MTHRFILTPAYGRDYTSRAAVLRDFAAGKDFIINAFGQPYDRKPVNREQLVADGVDKVNIRFCSARRVIEVPVGGAS